MSGTYSYTFTVSDIARVFDQVRADFHMAAQSTGSWTESFVDKLMDDVKRYATKGYLRAVAVYLVDSNDNPVRAATYSVSETASGWQADRPGNMLWPKIPGLRLRATIRMSPKWWNLTTTQRAEFEKGLQLEWPATNTQDLGFPTLSAANDRTYVSNGYGVQKISFK